MLVCEWHILPFFYDWNVSRNHRIGTFYKLKIDASMKRIEVQRNKGFLFKKTHDETSIQYSQAITSGLDHSGLDHLHHSGFDHQKIFPQPPASHLSAEHTIR